MTEEEKFDKIVRRKFAEKEFIFNEANWEKAEGRIDSVRRSGRVFRLVAVFLIGFSGGIALMLPFVIGKEEVNTHKISSSGSVKAEDRIAGAERLPEVIQEVSDKSALDAEQGSVAAEERAVRKDLIAKNETVGLGRPDKEDPSVMGTSPARQMRPALREVSAEKRSEASAGALIAEAVSVVPSEKAEQVNVVALTNTPSETPKEAFVQQTQTGGEKDPEAPSAAMDNSDQQLSLEVVTNKDSTIAGKQEVASVSVSSTTDPSAVALQSPPAEQPALRGIASTNIISFEAGANFHTGWNYHDTLEGRGLSPLAGVGYTYYFNPQWAFYSGIRYENIGGLKASRKVFSDTKYDFGYSAVNTIVETKSLHYLVLPLQFQYTINGKNAVRLGGSVSYLAFTQSNVSVYSRNSFGTSDVTEKEQNAFVNGFNQWDASLTLAFRRKISERFNVSVLADYGLLDIKSNDFFSNRKYERNVGLKAIVAWDLFQY